MAMFHWKSRVKSGPPELVGGAVETLASHVSDENAHPDYLKKGSVVPTGQEATTLVKHLADKLSHAWNLIRRSELLRNKDQYAAVKTSELSNDKSNFMAVSPIPHIVTAFVLNQILEGYVDKDTIKEMVKHDYLTAIGDGSQLLYVKEDGRIVTSTKTIGTNTKAVYVNNGVVTPLEYDCVLVEGDQTIGGVKLFNKIPRLSSSAGVPTQDNELVNLGYLRGRVELPINSIYTNSDGIDPAEVLGYGEWELVAELGLYGYSWKRLA